MAHYCPLLSSREGGPEYNKHHVLRSEGLAVYNSESLLCIRSRALASH